MEDKRGMYLRNRLIGQAIVLALLIMALAPLANGADVKINSVWAPGSIRVDGVRSDWPAGGMTFLSEQEVSVGVCNDTGRVYVMLCFNKPEWARLIRRAGLTIWLDAKGKKGKDFKIYFAGGPSMKQIMETSGQRGEESQRRMPPEMQERMRERDERMVDSFTCYQKEYFVEEPIPMDGAKGPMAASGIDKGFFVYEFSLPIEPSSVKIYGLGMQPGQTLGVGMVWGEFDRKKMREDMPERDGGMMIDGIGGGGRRGGMPEGGGGFPGGRMDGGQMPKKQEVWLKVRLTPSAGEADAAGKK